MIPDDVVAEVRDGVLGADRALATDHPGLEQDGFGQRRLPRPAVSDKGEVSRIRHSHGSSSPPAGRAWSSGVRESERRAPGRGANRHKFR